MAVVVRRGEVGVARLEEELLLARVDANGERVARVTVRTDPGEELAADLESRLAVRRRLLGSGKRPGDGTDGVPVVHQSVSVA